MNIKVAAFTVSENSINTFVKIQSAFEGYGDTKLSEVDSCPFAFRDVEYFSKYLKGYGMQGTPLQGLILSHQHNLIFVVKVFKVNANAFKANKRKPSILGSSIFIHS